MEKKHTHDRPTIGVLAGWQWYEGVTLHRYLEPVFYGIRTAAIEQQCNLLAACGVGEAIGAKAQAPPLRPAWPVLFPDVGFVPVGPWNTDGLIAITPLLSETRSRHLQELIAGGFPVVFINGGEKGPAILADNEVGIHQALAHLAQHGHRRIVFLAGHTGEVDDSAFRLNAYLFGVHQLKLEEDSELIINGRHNRFDGYRAMREILEAGVPFTAVLASNDESAFGAMRALSEAGRRIPQDVAIIGFDDRLDAMAQSPPLTSIRNPTFEAGYRALAFLLKLIDGQIAGDEVIHLPTRLVIRESCGCQLGGLPLPARPSLTAVRPDERSEDMVERNREASSEVERIEVSAIGSQLIAAMREAVLAESTLAEGRRLSVDEVNRLSELLWQTLLMALAEGDSARFQSVLVAVLGRTAAVGDDIFGWQAAISVLERHIPLFLPVNQGAARRQPEELLRQAQQVAARRQAEEWLRRAHVVIGREIQQQHIRHVVQRESIADLSGLLLARLLAALNEGEIFKILEESLPNLGLQRVRVGFFEPEADDPVAWSRLRALTGEPQSPKEPRPLEKIGDDHRAELRFPSREFPPPALYPDGEMFRLALLPLEIPEVGSGFVAFDAANLDLCAMLVQQLAAALSSAHLRQAEQDRTRELEQAYRTLQENQQKLLIAEKMASLGRMTAGIAHEMNTPLAAVRTALLELSQLAQEYESSIGDSQVTAKDYHAITDEMLRAIHLAEKAAEQAAGFVRGIKAQTRDLDSKERQRFNAVQVIRDTLLLLGYALRRANCPAVFEPAVGSVELYGSPGRLAHVVTNLVTNAIDASRERSGPITVRLTSSPQGIELAVSDHGSGIPPEHLSRIFDPMFTTKSLAENTGLGLTIAHDIVTSDFNGTIEADSQVGRGTTFTLRFPLPQEMEYGA